MDHAEEARRLLALVDEAAGRQGRSIPAEIGVQLAIAHGLLDIAAAIREQTAEIKGASRASQKAEPAW